MRVWPALLIEAPGVGDPPDAEELVSALLDDYAPQAIEDLVERPLPPGGLWDPTYPPPPEPPPSPLRWRVFCATGASRAAAGAALSATLPRLRLTAVDIPDDDWAARSQQHLTAVTAGHFIVAPPWDRPATLDDLRCSSSSNRRWVSAPGTTRRRASACGSSRAWTSGEGGSSISGRDRGCWRWPPP